LTVQANLQRLEHAIEGAVAAPAVESVVDALVVAVAFGRTPRGGIESSPLQRSSVQPEGRFHDLLRCTFVAASLWLSTYSKREPLGPTRMSASTPSRRSGSTGCAPARCAISFINMESAVVSRAVAT
jgi:hypothetical protein